MCCIKNVDLLSLTFSFLSTGPVPVFNIKTIQESLSDTIAFEGHEMMTLWPLCYRESYFRQQISHE